MNKNVIVYVKNKPDRYIHNEETGDVKIEKHKDTSLVGAAYFVDTMLTSTDGKPIIAMGWSKACRRDVFIKKTGREIATKRAEKVVKYIGVNEDTAPPIVRAVKAEEFDLGTERMEVNLKSLPYAIKDNLEFLFDKAKHRFGIDGQATFVFHVVENVIDITDALMGDLGVDDNLVSQHKTRYIKITR